MQRGGETTGGRGRRGDGPGCLCDSHTPRARLAAFPPFRHRRPNDFGSADTLFKASRARAVGVWACGCGQGGCLGEWLVVPLGMKGRPYFPLRRAAARVADRLADLESFGREMPGATLLSATRKRESTQDKG